MNRRGAIATALGAAFAAQACAPAVGFQEEPAASGNPRLAEDAVFLGDGARLPLKAWLAKDEQGQPCEPWGVMVALHGMNDYSEAFVIAGPFWAQRGVTTYAYDQRGFGRGPARGRWAGADLLASDLRTTCALVRERHPNAVLGVVGESMGGAVAVAALASAHPPSANRAILLSPAVWGWSEQPFENRLALWITAHLDPGATLVAPAWIARRYQASDNVEMLRRMGRDPNMIFATRADAAYGLVDLMQAASERLDRLKVPTLYAYGAHDVLIPKSAAFRAASRLSAPLGRTAYYPDGWHLLNRDLHAAVVLEDAVSFLRDPATSLPSGVGKIPGAQV